jgi:ABC-type sugar transport system permease subunit
MIMRWALRLGSGPHPILVPGIVTVVAAYSWQYAWTPGTGYLANLLPSASAPLTEQWPAIFIIIVAEIWKTTPFMALLLLAGLSLVPEELLRAAKVDGASGWQRFTQVILPLMRPAILVALLFRTLDAFRIFDNIFILTAGANNTRSVSILGYDNLFTALNLGIPTIRCWSVAVAMSPSLRQGFHGRAWPGGGPPMARNRGPKESQLPTAPRRRGGWKRWWR